MAFEKNIDEIQAIAAPYPADIPLSTMAQNVDIEELLMSRLETELLDPLMDHNKIRIRLKEMSAINLEVSQQLDEYMKTGKDGRRDPVVQRVGAQHARAQAILDRATKILNGNLADDAQAKVAIDSQPTKEEDQAMSTPTEKDYIDAKLAAATAQMIGDIKAAHAIMDGRLALLEQGLTSKVDAIGHQLTAQVADMKAASSARSADTVKWMAATMITLAALSMAYMTFLVNNASQKPAAAPAPIIIYTQPAPATAAPSPPVSPKP